MGGGRAWANSACKELVSVHSFLVRVHDSLIFKTGVYCILGSHSHHVYSAHDLCEPCVHTDGAAAANRRIRHPSTNNASYCNTVILVHVD